MSHEPPAAAGAASEVDDLVRRLGEINEAISRARDLGVPAPVPEPLYQACLALVARHDEPPGRGAAHRGSFARSTPVTGRFTSTPGQSRTARPTATARDDEDLVYDVPLRRLVWQVITPGEEFTVADVTARLKDLGVLWSANRVSNALGYWASRGRLNRCRKGVYLYPEAPAVDDDVDSGAPRETPVGVTNRAGRKAGGKEHDPHVSPTETRQAM